MYYQVVPPSPEVIRTNRFAIGALVMGKLTGCVALGVGYMTFPAHFSLAVVLFITAFSFLGAAVALCVKAWKLQDRQNPVQFEEV
jgi:hypothetical protein